MNNNIIPADEIRQNFKEDMLNQSKLMSSLVFFNKARKDEFIDKLDCIKYRTWRSALSRLRCGNFGLRIRNGAWIKEPKELRTCRFCQSNTIEDEMHILCGCHFFQNLRTKLLNDVQFEAPAIRWNLLDDLEKIKTMMENEQIVPMFAKFC